MAFAKILRQIVVTTSVLIKNMPELDIASKPSQDKWSGKEILGHLIDSAIVNHQRFVNGMSSEDALKFGSYDQDQCVQINAYQDRKSYEVLNTWICLNHHMALLLEKIEGQPRFELPREHNFEVIGFNRVSSDQSSSLSYLVWDYLAHIEHHILQIIPDYSRILAPYESYSS